MTSLPLGTAAVVASGILNGIFVLPMRMIKQWKWENMWLAFGFLGLFLLPTLLAFILVPHLLTVYSTVPALSLELSCGLGISWGVGSLLFGLGVSALGMSLGYAIIMGTSAIFGTLIPAMLPGPLSIFTWRSLELFASLVLICVALVLCAMAGNERERVDSNSRARYQTLTKTTFRKGLIFSVLSGILSACFNIGFATTTVISTTAEHFGASKPASTFSVWALIMGSGFLPSFLYCFYCFHRNRSMQFFTLAKQNWWHTFLMGVLWIAGVGIYGVGTSWVGSAGATIGWPILTSMTVFTANWVGIAGGEWNGAGRIARQYLYPGLALLVASVVFASMAGAY